MRTSMLAFASTPALLAAGGLRLPFRPCRTGSIKASVRRERASRKSAQKILRAADQILRAGRLDILWGGSGLTDAEAKDSAAQA